jgi:AcrR family transcriptional regulator
MSANHCGNTPVTRITDTGWHSGASYYLTDWSVRKPEAKKDRQMAAVKKLVRRRTEKVQRREQILTAALEEFSVNGYEATRLDDVATRAEISKGTIFLHFKSKRVLFRAVLRASIRPVFTGFDAFLQGFTGTAEVLLSDLLSRQYQEIVSNKRARSLFRLLIAEGGKFPELAQMYYREIIDPGASALGLVMDRGVASGEFQTTEIRKFPQMMAAPAALAVVWILVFGERPDFDLEAYQQVHLNFVLRALRNSNRRIPAKPVDSARAGEA